MSQLQPQLQPRSLSGQWLRSRAGLLLGGWVIFALFCVGCCCASLIARYPLLLHPAPDLRAGMASLGVSLTFHAVWNITLEALVAVSYFALAGLIAWRKPHDTAALTIALALVAFGAGLPGAIYSILSDEPIWTQPYGFLQALGWLLLLVFAFVFPTGRFVPRWTLPLLIPYALWVILFFRFAGEIAQGRVWVIGALFVVWALWFALGAGAQYYRYLHVSSWTERQQTKWVVVGFLGMLLGVFVAVLYHVASLIQLVSGADAVILRFGAVLLLCATALLVPVTVAIALLRHRLFDVDTLINRTLVYGSLTALLALIYFITVALLGVLFSSVSHESTQGSGVAITFATLFIATLFQPLRGKLQRGINQRFYRNAYNATRMIEAFAARLPNLVDIEQLRENVLGAVEQAMRPTFASLWLLEPVPRPPPAMPSQDVLEVEKRVSLPGPHPPAPSPIGEEEPEIPASRQRQ